jgi:hypothetical protein
MIYVDDGIDAKQVVMDYIDTEKLANGANVTTTPQLIGALGLDASSRSTPRANIAKRFEAAMEQWYAIVLDGHIDAAKYKKGAAPCVEVKVDTRKGSKAVTVYDTLVRDVHVIVV